MRHWWPLFLCLITWPALAQRDTTSQGWLVITEKIPVGMSKSQVYEAARKHWDLTFGQEPGARLEHADPVTGVLDGSARFNFRSTSITAREELLGVINYRVHIMAENGQCLVQVTHFSHVGNRGAPGQGIDLGRLYKGTRPDIRVRGIGIPVARRHHEDMVQQCTDRVHRVIRTFASRIRQEQRD